MFQISPSVEMLTSSMGNQGQSKSTTHKVPTSIWGSQRSKIVFETERVKKNLLYFFHQRFIGCQFPLCQNMGHFIFVWPCPSWQAHSTSSTLPDQTKFLHNYRLKILGHHMELCMSQIKALQGTFLQHSSRGCHQITSTLCSLSGPLEP